MVTREEVKANEFKALECTLNKVFELRRSILLDGDTTEEEIDKFIVEKSKEFRAEWENVGEEEMFVISLRELLDTLGADGLANALKKESTEDDELSQ